MFGQLVRLVAWSLLQDGLLKKVESSDKSERIDCVWKEERKERKGKVRERRGRKGKGETGHVSARRACMFA